MRSLIDILERSIVDDAEHRMYSLDFLRSSEPVLSEKEILDLKHELLMREKRIQILEKALLKARLSEDELSSEVKKLRKQMDEPRHGRRKLRTASSLLFILGSVFFGISAGFLGFITELQ